MLSGRVTTWMAGLLAAALLAIVPSQAQAEDGQFYGLLRERDLTPFGFMRLDLNAWAAGPKSRPIEMKHAPMTGAGPPRRKGGGRATAHHHRGGSMTAVRWCRLKV